MASDEGEKIPLLEGVEDTMEELDEGILSKLFYDESTDELLFETPTVAAANVVFDSKENDHEMVNECVPPPSNQLSPPNIVEEQQSISDSKFEEGIAVGYLHNVSPVKSGNHFDFQLQTRTKTVRCLFLTREKEAIP